MTLFLLRHNYVIYLSDVVTFFDNVRITLYFGTFELRKEITLQLHFIFARHCDVFLLRHNYVICVFVVVTFFADVSITLYSNYVLKLSYKKVILVAFVSSQKMTKNYVIIT